MKWIIQSGKCIPSSGGELNYYNFYLGINNNWVSEKKDAMVFNSKREANELIPRWKKNNRKLSNYKIVKYG